MDQRRIERRTASTLLNLEENQMLKRNYTTKPQALLTSSLPKKPGFEFIRIKRVQRVSRATSILSVNS